MAGFDLAISRSRAANGKQMELRVIRGENLPPPLGSASRLLPGFGMQERGGIPARDAPDLLRVSIGIAQSPRSLPRPFPYPSHLFSPSLPFIFPIPVSGRAVPAHPSGQGSAQGSDVQAPAAPKHLPKPSAAEGFNSIRALI